MRGRFFCTKTADLWEKLKNFSEQKRWFVGEKTTLESHFQLESTTKEFFLCKKPISVGEKRIII